MNEIIAVVDIETTCLDPIYNDIIELAIQPLDTSFELSEDIPVFFHRRIREFYRQ